MIPALLSSELRLDGSKPKAAMPFPPQTCTTSSNSLSLLSEELFFLFFYLLPSFFFYFSVMSRTKTSLNPKRRAQKTV
jgi:hypothetical protein